MLPRGPRLHYVSDIATHGEALDSVAVEHGQEGILAKRADARYESRHPTWRKIKNPAYYRQEAFVECRE